MYAELRQDYSEAASSVSTPKYWESIWESQVHLIKGRMALTRQSELWEQIRTRVHVPSSVLDAGCGLGEWVELLCEEGYRAIGVDYSQATLRSLLRQPTNSKWVYGTVQSIPIADEQFDAVISWGVVEHDEDGPQVALREFFRVTRPGGYVFVTTPLDSKWMRRSSRVQFPSRRERRRFFQYFFTPAELSDELHRAGFDTLLSKAVIPSPLPVLFPRIYMLANSSPWKYLKASGIASRIANCLFSRLPQARSMVLVIGRRR